METDPERSVKAASATVTERDVKMNVDRPKIQLRRAVGDPYGGLQTALRRDSGPARICREGDMDIWAGTK